MANVCVCVRERAGLFSCRYICVCLCAEKHEGVHFQERDARLGERVCVWRAWCALAGCCLSGCKGQSVCGSRWWRAAKPTHAVTLIKRGHCQETTLREEEKTDKKK